MYCVFHSIRFKVNKGWSTAVLLFLCPYVWSGFFLIVPLFLWISQIQACLLMNISGWPVSHKWSCRFT
ncbi:hypothetical protein B5F71_17170 [Bacteroides sp. An269]|nr:hypothetical protein B5F71_17170 [Bacteroides sp. An269]